MNTSILIARLMGPVMLVAGFAMLVNRESVKAMAGDFMESPALIYLAGALTLLLGLALVNFHNHWVAGWPVIITVFGWICIASGIFRMAFPTAVRQMGRWMLAKDGLLIVAAIVNTALGAWLSWMGYLA